MLINNKKYKIIILNNSFIYIFFDIINQYCLFLLIFFGDNYLLKYEK